MTRNTTKEIHAFLLASGVHAEDITTIPIFLGRSKLNQKGAREKLVKAIRGIHSDKVFTHLILNTHGETNFDIQGVSWTTLALIGSFSEKEIGLKMREVFLPLQGQFSRNLRVVLNSCRTMCGSAWQRNARSEVLLNFLGAQDGSIYGAETDETDSWFSDLDSPQSSDAFRSYKYALEKIALITLVGTALGVISPSLLMLPPDFALEYFMPLTLFGAAAGLISTPFILKSLAKKGFQQILAGELNFGSIYYLKNGKVFRTQPLIKKLENIEQVYALDKPSCAKLLKKEQ